MLGSKASQHHQEGKCRSRVATGSMARGPMRLGRGERKNMPPEIHILPQTSAEKSLEPTHTWKDTNHIWELKFSRLNQEGTMP